MRVPTPPVLAGAALLAFLPLSAAGQATRLEDVRPYLMEPDAEVALARSAAPFGLGAEAEVWVLTSGGYERAAEGRNGFACFVGRGWSGPILVGPAHDRRLHPDVFDTALRAPHCFNPAAVATVLPWHLARTDLVLAGVPAAEVDERLSRDLAAGRLSPPEIGAMAYMMSSGQDLGPDFGAWRPHVMVYLPNRSNRDWGIPGFTHDFPFIAEGGTPWSVAVLPMRVYADGTTAPEDVAGRH